MNAGYEVNDCDCVVINRYECERVGTYGCDLDKIIKRLNGLNIDVGVHGDSILTLLEKHKDELMED